MQKIAILAPSDNGQHCRAVSTQLRHVSTIGKKLLNIDTSSTCPGELRPANGWDPLASFGQPCKFQRLSHVGSVTAWHSSSGRHPNFVALNRGRYLYLAGRPSRWALAHILVYSWCSKPVSSLFT